LALVRRDPMRSEVIAARALARLPCPWSRTGGRVPSAARNAGLPAGLWRNSRARDRAAASREGEATDPRRGWPPSESDRHVWLPTSGPHRDSKWPSARSQHRRGSVASTAARDANRRL